MLLRFYWFRLSDVAVPLGAALGIGAMIDGLLRSRPAAGRNWLAFAILAASLHAGYYAIIRAIPTPPRADRWVDYVAWREACDWIAQSGRIPENARFLTPLNASTFKWYAERSDVVNWKDAPQDASSMVAWWDRVQEIHGTGQTESGRKWYGSLADIRPSPEQAAARLRQLGAEYHAGYVISEVRHRLPLDVVYQNDGYAIYRLPETKQP
jgi:hypothetical protein